MTSSAPTVQAAPAEGDWFLFAADFMVPDPQKAAQVQDFAKQGVLDLWGLYPPITPEVMDFIREGNNGFLYFLPASDTIITNFQHLVPRGATASVEFVEGERAKVQELTKSMGGRIWWDVMPEFDSSLSWPSRKLRPTDPTRAGFYRQWSDGYLSLQPLAQYLQMTPKQRGFNLASTTGFSCHTHYAYELGSQLNMLERDNDDIGDLTTGIAFARGAGRQFSRPWGIDISVWRCATDSIPEFDENGRLTGGWSPEYVKRHLYLSYMAGANMIRMEPTGYHDREGERNPIGQLVVDFGRFAREHPNRGRPQVSTAVMLDFYHGFEPKYGEYTQGDSVWYNQIPYSAGDHMTNNFLRLAFPDHWLSGTTPGAFWAPNQRARENPKEMRDRMKQGMDPRPYEPMGTSRWGDHIDVLLSNASLTALRKYRTIILVGDVKVEGTLQSALSQWVKEGGTLVANVAHFPAPDEALTGVKLTGQSREASQSRWLQDKSICSEPQFQYAVVQPAGAEVLADDGNGAPLITRHRVGKGEVILSTPD
ncbi:MAG: hypothetical protein MUQ26_07245, partial [Armatimonadetes bacterium]|nr:hypothetical protein [Armatimonadota bacterium]